MKKDSDQIEWLVIVNPNAGNGKGKKDWHKISALLNGQGISFSVRFTERKNHAIEFTREAIAEGYRKIISVGGDGTLNEIVNGVFTQDHCSPATMILGMIPVGTGNDWGRMFGIPLDYEGAVGIIKECKIMLHDTGVIKYYSDSEERKRYFINIAGMGFDAMVVKRANAQKDKGKGGKLIYFYNLLMSLLSYKNIQADIDIDGKKVSAEIFTISIGNGIYCGGGMRQTPAAIPDDGLLDITIIRSMGKIEIIRSLKKLFDGSILSHPKVESFKFKNLMISTDPVIFAQADGESIGHTPVEIGIIPKSINIVYGTRLIP